MNISKDTVKYVANLARLGLNDEELEKFSLQLNDILQYIEQLKEVDISKIAPTAHVLDIKNVKREDEPSASLPVKEALNNSPQKEGSFF
ncbi:MAG: Asp-tRNA(Asn)/Glu-tRNA(Gln) amidotransferase subunit GatC, partial [Candidatus Omnitrophica bacterium]|nr:Asp-tRNA(Asn)/Glu-tRNA(Gln) amidotransferase subunit GatC [Candidatus Omnitrophota bacterium]